MFCYYYEKKRSGLFNHQDHRLSSKNEKRNVKIENEDYKKHVDLKYAEIKICAEFEKKKHARKEKVNREFELYEIRQVIYARLSHDARMRTRSLEPSRLRWSSI